MSRIHCKIKNTGSIHRSAFSLVELMVTVAILGIVTGVTINISQASWRRERAVTATIMLLGWLEQIARSPERDGISCRVDVNITTGSNVLRPGSMLASVTPSTCAFESRVLAPGSMDNSGYQVNVLGASDGPISSQKSWWFTPRGAISTTTPSAISGSSATDIVVSISMEGNPPIRCVRLSGTVGLLRSGRNNASGNTNVDSCNEWSLR